MSYDSDHPQEESAELSMPLMTRSHGLTRDRNYTERLNDEIKSLEEALKRKQKLKTLLDENPVIREALELMS